MTKQPEALRITDVIEFMRDMQKSEREGWRYADELEQEKKRLHVLNQELLEALRINLEVLEKVDPYKGQEDLLIDVVCMNKELIAKATGEQA